MTTLYTISIFRHGKLYDKLNAIGDEQLKRYQALIDSEYFHIRHAVKLDVIIDRKEIDQ